MEFMNTSNDSVVLYQMLTFEVVTCKTLNEVRKRMGDCGSTVVKTLCYKSEGRWFDSRWCHWNFSLT